jgi:protein required for attachment to host cells
MRGKLAPVPVTGDIYVVVADAAHARLFSASPGKGRLDELADLVNPAVRLHPRASQGEGLGRSMDSTSRHRHAVEPQQTPRRRSADTFARRVARLLSKARTDGRIRRLYVVAEPGFLGLLRRNMDRATRRLVRTEIAKALPHASGVKIRQVLPSVL